MTAINSTTEVEFKTKIQLVKKSYLKGYAWGVAIALGGGAISGVINLFCPFSLFLIRLFQCLSVIPTAGALFGLCGWEFQTWEGDTPPELLNQKLFRISSALGLLLPIIAFSLEPAQ